jgi:hypothetical protein
LSAVFCIFAFVRVISRSFPHRRPVKPATALLCLALILAGCGGHAAAKSQTVTGPDFRFQAPAGWKVTREDGTVTAADGNRLVRVQTFNLLKPYKHELLGRATKELDADAAKLASALNAKVAAKATLAVAGHDARMYTLAYGDNRQQITFVLDGSREYELICKIDSEQAASACSQLASTFSLT